MIVKCTHLKTELSCTLNNNTKARVDIRGDAQIVTALRSYIDSFKDSYANKGDRRSAWFKYDDLYSEEGGLGSVDTAADRFITQFLLPELTAMGYSCEIIP